MGVLKDILCPCGTAPHMVMNLVTRLPEAIWFEENSRASDTRFENNLLELVSAQTLLLLDRGFYHFQFWQQLIDRGVHFR